MGIGTLLANWLHPVSGQCLTPADADLWAEAQTLEDLGELTAMWLRGDIESQPGYYGTVDVDEDDAPGMTDALVALNLAGFLTDDSQAGWDGPGSGGGEAVNHWVQRAAVMGYADLDTYLWLRAVVRPTPFEIRAWVASRRRNWRPGNRQDYVPVTWCNGWEMTGYGRHSRASAAFSYEGCSDAATAAVVNAWQVVIYDPRPGCNDLWADLHEAAAERAG